MTDMRTEIIKWLTRNTLIKPVQFIYKIVSRGIKYLLKR